MKNREIERKYLVKDFSNNIEIEEIRDIEQIMIYRDKKTRIRIRKLEITNKNQKNEMQYVYTVKTNGDIVEEGKTANIYEIESNITEEYFKELSKKILGNKISKRRIVVPIQDELKVEIDIYYDYLEGFLTAEVEFQNEEQAKNFKKPEWLGEEIGYKQFSNNKLSQMTEQEFKSKVSEEIMENNKKVIEKLNEKTKKFFEN